MDTPDPVYKEAKILESIKEVGREEGREEGILIGIEKGMFILNVPENLNIFDSKKGL